MNNGYELNKKEEQDIIRHFGQDFFARINENLAYAISQWEITSIHLIESYSANLVFRKIGIIARESEIKNDRKDCVFFTEKELKAFVERTSALVYDLIMRKCFSDIPGSGEWTFIEFVDKGWSQDLKYHIATDEGDHLLLRISGPETYKDKRKEYAVIQQLSKLDFAMSKGRDFGTCNAGVYMVLDWIEGQDMEAALQGLSSSAQYQLGYEAGRILKLIHGVEVEYEPFSWEDKFNEKIDRKIRIYEDCPLKYERGYLFLEHLNRSRHLLKDRPITLQHGDYHVGNMICSRSGHVGIIDFNRFDFGDPWEEFNRIVWDIQCSPYFAAGRIDGYFNGQVPEAFFALLTVYIASNTLSSLPWAMDFGDQEIEIMRNQAKEILDTYDDFSRVVPKWYLEVKDKMSL